MTKTLWLSSTAFAVPKFVYFIIGIPLSVMFTCIVHYGAVGHYDPSFYNVFHGIWSDYMSEIEWVNPDWIIPGGEIFNEPTRDYADRAKATLGISSLIATMGSGTEITFVLNYAICVAHKISIWQSDLSIEDQEALRNVFQNIRDNALQLMTLCNNIIINDETIPREISFNGISADRLDAIGTLLRNIFKGFCTIYIRLGGGRENLNFHFQGEMMRQMSFSDAVAYTTTFINTHILG